MIDPSARSHSVTTGGASNPLSPFLERQGVVILDAGLATALEDHGHCLNDPLWSARLLIDEPDAIRQIHADFLAAGADCITTASYQASLAGFRERGIDDEEGIGILRRSVLLALEARDDFWRVRTNRIDRLKPLVATSVGPYGAVLGDGSEYRGDYAISDHGLAEFHRERWEILADCDADLLACETIPSGREATVLLGLLDASPGTWAWMSFCCGDGSRLWDGTAIEDVAAHCDEHEGVAAIGVNCTAPPYIDSLIAATRRATDKPVIVYPNSGEGYDPQRKQWRSKPDPPSFPAAAAGWYEHGARCIGGCCRVRADDVRKIRRRLVG